MGLLDRITRRTPATTARDDAPPPSRPRGGSGRHHTSGFLQLEELNPNLQGERGLEIYDRMYRTDPDVARVVSMVCNPIISGTWIVEPHGGDDASARDRQIADDVRWALFDHMRPGWRALLAELMPVLVRSGFELHEQIWGRVERDGRELLVPRKLDLRLPRSIHQWHQNDEGELLKVVQFLMPGGQTPLPVRDLLYLRVGAEGDNWEGTSLLRRVYKPWKLKDTLERIDAVRIEREACGIPVLYPPTQAARDTELMDQMEERIAKLRAGEDLYLVMPGPHADNAPEGVEGWRFDIVGFGGQGSGESVERSLRYHQQEIAAGFIADFMELGKHGEGARATADVQQDPFLAGVEALAGVVEDGFNQQIVPRIVALNHGQVDGTPKVAMSKADRTSLAELQTFVSGLVTAGVLQGDEKLEDWVRERADMPAADPQERKRRQQAREEAGRQLPPAPTDKPRESPKNPQEISEEKPDELAALSRQDRPLRPWEHGAALDQIESTLDTARDQFVQAGRAGARAVARRVAQDAAQGTERASTAGAVPDELVDALEQVLDHLYTVGQTTARAEVDAQQERLEPATVNWEDLVSGQRYTLDAAGRRRLRRRARLAAQNVVMRVVQQVIRITLGDDQPDLAALQAAGEQEADAALKAEAQVHASPALGQGRGDYFDEIADQVAGVRYTSILDGNRCEQCSRADDGELRPLDDPVRLARKPPNRDCYGGTRCRCIEIAQLKSEQPG